MNSTNNPLNTNNFFKRNHALQTGLFLVLLLSLGSCYKTDFFPCVRGTGQTLEEVRTSTPFSDIDLMIHGQVFVTQADDFHVSVVAPQSLLPFISTSVTGNTLIINNDRCLMNRIHEIQVFVSMPEVDRLHVSGSGTIALQDIWETAHLTLNVSGSGKISGTFLADNISTRISGSGDIDITGNTVNHHIAISGSGKVNCYSLDCSNADVRISGSGQAYLYASESIYAKISGSGNVFYQGNPAVDAVITGSGKIIRR